MPCWFEEGHDAVVEQIRGRDRGFSARMSASGSSRPPGSESEQDSRAARVADYEKAALATFLKDELGLERRHRMPRRFTAGPSDCLVCHNANAGHVLGVRTAQLNGELEDSAALAPINRRLAWSDRGVIDVSLDAETVASLPQLASLADEERSIEDRVRSCVDAKLLDVPWPVHRGRATWALATRRRSNGSTYRRAAIGRGGLAQRRAGGLPGHPKLSTPFQRDGSTDAGLRMPPIGRQTVDREWLALLERWISTLPARWVRLIAHALTFIVASSGRGAPVACCKCLQRTSATARARRVTPTKLV